MGVKMITNDDNCTFELSKEKKETKKIKSVPKTTSPKPQSSKNWFWLVKIA